jgi:hypothetical protein
MNDLLDFDGVYAILDGSGDQCRHHRLRFDGDPAASCPGGPKFSAQGVSEKPLKADTLIEA